VRRLASLWARLLGAAAGVEAVEEFAAGVISRVPEATREELLATLAPGHASWDEEGAQAGAAGFDRYPKGHEAAYYEAYERAARERVLRLAEERS
jgi:hypothetical protein